MDPFSRVSMRHLSTVVVLAIGLLPSPGSAQATPRPTQAQAEVLLRSRPDLLARLRDEIASSGMTAAQVRARLRAEGYSENLLDAYLGSGTAANNAKLEPRTLEAVRALGIMDDEDAEALYEEAGFALPASRRKAAVRAPVDMLQPRDPTLSMESERIFGLDLFQDPSTQFRPNVEGPVDAGYRVGPGDELVLILTGEVEAAHTLPVTREGFVVIPDVGQVGVANLTLEQVENLLYARLRRVYSGVRRGADAPVKFSVSVSRLRSVQVFVTGDVAAPGAQRLSAAGTALTALYAAGGPTEQGSFRSIVIRRAGAVVAELDLYDYLLRGDASRDIRLEQGDIVFVPVHGPLVRVDGEVTRPATYELRRGETLETVLAAAGGLRASAGARRVVVERILPAVQRAPGGADRVVMDVPLGSQGALPGFVMEAGDVVRVPAVSASIRNRIRIDGHVWNPGLQGFAPGLTITEALRRAGGTKPDAYLPRVLVSRLLADSTRTQQRVTLTDTTGMTAHPFMLEENDQVTVFSRTEFRPDQYVAIGGAVRKGGRYPYRSGMTLRDLVLKAGGLEAGAYLREAEIARLPVERNAMVTATTIRVPLDSTFLFDRGEATPLTATGDDAVLQPFDNVLILRDPNWRTPASVLLTGEVAFPGRYTLRSRSDRLAGLITRAGGLTPLADQRATHFSRITSTKERAQLDSLTARSDSIRFALQPNRIRVGLNLEAALRRPDSGEDLLLLDGDSLHISTKQQTVEIRGEVNAPTALTHTDRRLGFYVAAAGGPNVGANERRAYVIQPNGKVQSRHRFLWLVNIDPKPLPGATVVVPAKDPNRQPTNLVASVGLAAQVLASLAAIIVVAQR